MAGHAELKYITPEFIKLTQRVADNAPVILATTEIKRVYTNKDGETAVVLRGPRENYYFVQESVEFIYRLLVQATLPCSL